VVVYEGGWREERSTYRTWKAYGAVWSVALELVELDPLGPRHPWRPTRRGIQIGIQRPRNKSKPMA